LKILAIDDDREVRESISRILVAHGMECTCAADSGAARRILLGPEAPSFELILLDVLMPGATGWEFLAELRAQGNDTPVIFLTGRDTTEERVKGLRLGADDYIVKPFETSELLARIEAVVRRRRSMPTLEVGDVWMDLGRRIVMRRSQRIEVSPGEFDLLRTLMEARGAAVSRAELLAKVWGIDFDPGTKVVEVQIARLRKKIDRVGPPLIQTVVGSGYRIAPPDEPN
jgi:DNA-binding response OmpR family regulator